MNLLRNEQGFTMQELLVVLIVSSLLAGFCFSLFLFTSKLLLSWQRNTEVRSIVNGTLNTLVLDVQQSKQVTEITDTTLVLVKRGNRTVVYHFSRNRIFRDHDVVASQDGIQLSVLVSKEIQNQKSAQAPVLTIKVSGTSTSNTYQSETRVTLPYSGREAFIRTSNGI
ncbi:MAG: prepilin-type N-terminal cleavage/methylation domain-containing protein [Ignavibacteria bacterium]|nr:prepilin-type N-terminal cleavage/methylation domain-containing protein [Ignavibacteria bacterium]